MVNFVIWILKNQYFRQVEKKKVSSIEVSVNQNDFLYFEKKTTTQTNKIHRFVWRRKKNQKWNFFPSCVNGSKLKLKLCVGKEKSVKSKQMNEQLPSEQNKNGQHNKKI